MSLSKRLMNQIMVAYVKYHTALKITRMLKDIWGSTGVCNLP